MWRSSSPGSTAAAGLGLVSVCMPAAWPARLPETFLRGRFGGSETLERNARPLLVKQLPGRREALGRAAQRLGGGSPKPAPPASCSVLRALQELAGAVELARARTRRRRRDVVAGRAEPTHPAWVEERLCPVDERQRLRGVLGHLQQHAVDEEQQVLRQRRDVRELERLLQLRPRTGAVADVEQQLSQTQASERLAADRSKVAAEPGRVEKRRAGRLEVADEELR